MIVIGLALFAFIAGDAWKVMQPHQAHDVGEVNGDALSAQEYQNLVEEYTEVVKLMRGVTALNDEQTNQVRDEVWRSYVNNKLIEKEAKALGLTVSAAEIQDILKAGVHPLLRQTPFQNPQTGNFDKDMLNKFLVEYAKMSESQMPAQYAEQYNNMYKYWSFIQKTLIESRLAVAQQLTEISRIMDHMAEELYDIMPADPQFQEDLRKAFRKKHIVIRRVWVMDKVEGRRQVFLNMRARSGQCVSMVEISQILSRICGSPMTPEQGSRSIVNGEFHTVHFVEDVSYQMLYGVARLTREQEKVSGDNYICRQEEDGRFFLCLSDGMGSGMEAFKESEIVVELLEQFMESGLSQETAARMVNSALLLKGREGMFSTVDICAVDLYTGICNFLKAGASSTFIKRDHWVESIASESLAAGLVQQLDFDTASRKLYHGDYLIMMTDGVLDALPAEREEETMKEIIMDVHEKEPKEMGRGILERVLGYSDYRARDDMTVVVAGLWKK